MKCPIACYDCARSEVRLTDAPVLAYQCIQHGGVAFVLLSSEAWVRIERDWERARAFIARFMGRSLRTVRDAINTAIAKSEPLQHCPVCDVLIVAGQPCPDCAADKEAREWREAWLDDSGFWGPTLPPRERAVREGPLMIEIGGV